MNQSHNFLKGLVMTKPQIKSAGRIQQRQRSGMTLIELLVAISILVIIAAILVPQLRFASADRNIREASRTVASLFAEASQRAINEGVSGVVIERNPNITDATGAYAGTSMFILREVPPYIGTGVSDQAEYIQTSTVQFPDVPEPEDLVNVFNPDRPLNSFDIWIPAPFEDGIVQAGDQISFNGQPIRLNIVSVTPETHIADSSEDVLRLGVAFANTFVANNLPMQFVPDDNNNTRVTIGDFIVHRQPRKLVSSRIDMPTGYLVDLRLSGEVDVFTGANLFTLDPRTTVTPPDPPNSVAVLFNGRGSVDRYVFTDFPISNPVPTRVCALPTQPVYLLVREYSTDDGGETIQSVLSSERQMWVTVELTTGAANVISGVGVNGAFTSLAEALAEARQLGSQGQAAQ